MPIKKSTATRPVAALKKVATKKAPPTDAVANKAAAPKKPAAKLAAPKKVVAKKTEPKPAVAKKTEPMPANEKKTEPKQSVMMPAAALKKTPSSEPVPASTSRARCRRRG